MKNEIVDDTSKLKLNCVESLKGKAISPRRLKKCQYYFTIGQLGTSLWMKTLENLRIPDFLFFDPESHEIPITYNSLSDPYLKKFFRRENIVKHLRKNRLITFENEIICNIKEFNNYCKLLNRLKAEQTVFKHANNISLEENVHKLSKVYKRRLTRNFNQVKMELEEERRAKFLDNIKVYENRLKRIEIMRTMRENEIKERGLYRNLESIKKRIYVLEKRKAYRVKLKQRIFDREGALNNQMLDDESEKSVHIIRCPSQL